MKECITALIVRDNSSTTGTGSRHVNDQEWQYREHQRFVMRKVGLLGAMTLSAVSLSHFSLLFLANAWSKVYCIAVTIGFGAAAMNVFRISRRSGDPDRWHAKMSIREKIVFSSLFAIFIICIVIAMVAVTQ